MATLTKSVFRFSKTTEVFRKSAFAFSSLERIRNFRSPSVLRSDAETAETPSLKNSSASRYSEKEISKKTSKIVLPPRLCTLRVFRENGEGGVVKAEPDSFTDFFASLVASVDHDAKFKDWETFSGRLAMVVFAATVNAELLTGNSIFHKVDMQKIYEFGGICILSIIGAALFAWASSARTQVSSIFTDNCNKFVDSMIDQLIDGLFYEEGDAAEK